MAIRETPLLILPVATCLAVIVATVLRVLIRAPVPIAPEVALVLPIPMVLRVTPVLPVVAQVVTATPDVLILPIVMVPRIPAILSVVATVLPVTLRPLVLPLVLLRVLPLVLLVGIACRVAHALIGGPGRLSRWTVWSRRTLCVRKRHCRCERRADSHRQEGIVLHDTSFFADQQRSTIFTIP